MSLYPIPISEQLDWLAINRDNAANNLFGLPAIFGGRLKRDDINDVAN